MAFTEAQIDTIFDSDHRKTAWDKFDDAGQKQRLIDHAERLLTMYNATVLGNVDADTGDADALDNSVSALTDTIRHDVAVALQALHIGESSMTLADGTTAGPVHYNNLNQESTSKDNDEKAPFWSEEALMYMTGNPNQSEPDPDGEGNNWVIPALTLERS